MKLTGSVLAQNTAGTFFIDLVLNYEMVQTVFFFVVVVVLNYPLFKGHQVGRNLLSVALAGSAQVFKPEHCIHSVSSLKFI